MRASIVPLAAVGIAATVIVAVAAPLWTYALSLALFGLPHVVVELRYVDERFGARVGEPVARWLGIGLLGIVALRLLGIAGVGASTSRAMLELVFGAGLAVAIVPLLMRRSLAHAALGAATVITAIGFALCAPSAALVVFALLHNLTPVGFLAERLRGVDRRRAMAWCAIVFFAIPAVIASGLLDSLFDWPDPFVATAAVPRVGALDEHLPAFVPSPLLGDAVALDLFRAAAFLQCMHYAAVLHVLPRLGGGSERDRSRFLWPKPSRLTAIVTVVTALFVVGFWTSFIDARASYGVFAAIHAWLEIPVLLLASAAAPLGEPIARARLT